MPSDDPLVEELKNRRYFFDDGLRFECQQCGRCCNGDPGLIHVDEDEIARIALYLNISRDVLMARCTYQYDGGYSIREDESGRCLFYENGCSIYPVRPVQCATFPFWFQYLRSEDGWMEAMKRCPGVGKGRTYSKEEIFELLEASYRMYIHRLKQTGED